VIQESSRYSKKISDECMIARPGPAIALLIGF
jgi:hypothetical protein